MAPRRGKGVHKLKAHNRVVSGKRRTKIARDAKASKCNNIYETDEPGEYEADNENFYRDCSDKSCNDNIPCSETNFCDEEYIDKEISFLFSSDTSQLLPNDGFTQKPYIAGIVEDDNSKNFFYHKDNNNMSTEVFNDPNSKGIHEKNQNISKNFVNRKQSYNIPTEVFKEPTTKGIHENNQNYSKNLVYHKQSYNMPKRVFKEPIFKGIYDNNINSNKKKSNNFNLYKENTSMPDGFLYEPRLKGIDENKVNLSENKSKKFVQYLPSGSSKNSNVFDNEIIEIMEIEIEPENTFDYINHEYQNNISNDCDSQIPGTGETFENFSNHNVNENTESSGSNVDDQIQELYCILNDEMRRRTNLEDNCDQACTPLKELLGRRINEPVYFYNEILDMHLEHGQKIHCSIADIYFKNFKEKEMNVSIQFACDECEYYKWVDLNESRPTAMPLGRGAIAGAIASGNGYSQLKQILAGMGIPCMSGKSYISQRQKMIEYYDSTAEECMEEAAQMERNLAIMAGDVINGVPFITVTVDGSWLKRSYRTGKHDSLSGCAAIIGYRTRKVLYVGVRNKFCSVCDYAIRNKIPVRKHLCFKNWGRDQASCSMEKDIIVQGFKDSIKIHSLIYKTIVGDGDSSVYKAIIDNNPYRDYNVRVDKIECENHLLRNMCNKIVEASKGKLGFSIARGQVKSFRNLIEKKAFSIRKHIQVLVVNIKDEFSDYFSEPNLKKLQLQIMNSVDHCFGNHKQCRKLEVPCEIKKGEKNWIPLLQKTGRYYTIQEAVKIVACHKKSLLEGLTNNYVESFNSIVAKMVGGKRINFGQRDEYHLRVKAAVIQFNTQKLLTLLNECNGFTECQVPEILERSMIRKVEDIKVQRILLGRRRTRYVKNGEADYGENVNSPDISKEAYDVLVEQHVQKLKADQANREQIEQKTRGQSNCDMWRIKRQELLTASNFGRVCRRRKTTKTAPLVKDILYPSLLSVPALTYGIENEADSRKNLSKMLKKKIVEGGLLISEYEGEEFIGGSVDGFIGEDTICEIKTPLSAANMTIREAMLQKPHLRKIFDKKDIKKMNATHIYYYQVQGLLHITKRKYCIFALCTKKGIKQVCVERDDIFWKDEIEKHLRFFYYNCLLPEILDSRFNRNMELREPAEVITAIAEKDKKSSDKPRKKLRTNKNNVASEKSVLNNRFLHKTKKTFEAKKSKKTNTLNVSKKSKPLNESKKINSSKKNVMEKISMDDDIHEVENIEEAQIVLQAASSPNDLPLILTYLKNEKEYLSDDCIELFFNIVLEHTKDYEIHPIIYYRFIQTLPKSYLNFHGKVHLQIIGGHPQYRHFILIHYDGNVLKIYDSLNRGLYEALNKPEIDYLNFRYPNLNRSQVEFIPVTQQLDGTSCGVFAMAFMTSIILKENPSLVKYVQDSRIIRNHAATIIKHRRLFNFPYTL